MKKVYIVEHKEMYDSWNWEKNNELGFYPEKITIGSEKKVWWKCPVCGHEWITEPYHRKAGRSCPMCAKEKRLENFQKTILNKRGSLLQDNPDLCIEWDYEKNIGIYPSEISPRAPQIVWWKCSKCGHEWKASISNRNSKNFPTGCPSCSLVYQSSIPEKIVLYYVRKIFCDSLENQKLGEDNNFELDIYIPSLQLGVEYDGSLWHKDIARDLNKEKLCQEKGIHLIRLREKGCENIDSKAKIINIPKIRTNYKQLYEPLVELFEYIKQKFGLNFRIVIDIEKDIYDVYKNINFNKVENSIINAEFFSEWDFEKNTILPENVSIHSNKVFWWKCKHGHEWKSSVNNRANGNKCPVCSNKKILKGYNDLATTHPEFLKEWNYEKNKDIQPDAIFAGANKKVWWKCEKGHEWQASPNTRIGQKTSCPICSNHRVLKGYNDLATTHPKLLKEWNYDKNKAVQPDALVAGSNKKVWWICRKCGYEWQAPPTARVYAKRGCKKCAHRKIGLINAKPIAGKSFADLYPELLVLWDYEKNKISPYEIAPSSNKKVWWICENGHSYQRKVIDQKKRQTCPICKPRMKKIACVETGIVYDSLVSAAKAFGYKKSNNIWAACNDNKKTFCGYHWQYVEDEEGAKV